MNQPNQPGEGPQFVALSINVEPARLRAIIEGLRKLPNVADMAVISAIAELDRIASIFEEADRKRQQMLLESVENLRRAVLSGNETPTEGCECLRCTAIRSIREQEESKRKSLNS